MENTTKTLMEFLDSCPPEGGTGPFVVRCNGKIFSSFKTEDEAKRVRDMYATTDRGKNAKVLYTWEVGRR